MNLSFLGVVAADLGIKVEDSTMDHLQTGMAADREDQGDQVALVAPMDRVGMDRLQAEDMVVVPVTGPQAVEATEVVVGIVETSSVKRVGMTIEIQNGRGIKRRRGIRYRLVELATARAVLIIAR